MNVQKGQKVWLAKYALSEGVCEEVVRGGSSREKWITIESRTTWALYKLGRDVFTNREDAVVAADVLRHKKLASLRKSIAKLEKMEF